MWALVIEVLHLHGIQLQTPWAIVVADWQICRAIVKWMQLIAPCLGIRCRSALCTSKLVRHAGTLTCIDCISGACFRVGAALCSEHALPLMSFSRNARYIGLKSDTYSCNAKSILHWSSLSPGCLLTVACNVAVQAQQVRWYNTADGVRKSLQPTLLSSFLENDRRFYNLRH